jgi:hypothetical protein
VVWLSLYCVQVEEYQYWMYKIKMLSFARFRDDLAIFGKRLNSDFADHFTQYTWKWIYLMFQFLKLFLTASLQRCFPTLCKDGLRTFALIFIFFSDAIIQISWYYCKMFSTFSSLFENSGFILLYHYWYKFRYVLTSYYNLVKLIIEY